MNMMDMGRKSNETNPPIEGDKKIRINYPGFSLGDNQIPEELANAKVGDMCRLEIIVKKTGDDIDTYDNNKPRVQIEVHKLGYIGKAGKLSKEEFMNKSDEEKEEYQKQQVESEVDETGE